MAGAAAEVGSSQEDPLGAGVTSQGVAGRGTTWCWPWAPQLSHQRSSKGGLKTVPSVPGRDQELLGRGRVLKRVLLPAETRFF